MMVRDTIGANGDSTVFASNMVYGGGYRGLLQAVMREKVEESSGAGAKISSLPLNAKFPAKGTKFRLTIRKTNTGYHILLNDDPASEKIFYQPALMQVQDKTKLYAGFFAARSASIKVTNIELAFSDPKSDPPALPELSILSPLETSAGENLVDLRLASSEGQFVTSSAAISRQVKITVKSFGNFSMPLNVSPAEKTEGDGTKEKPLDLYTATKATSTGIRIAGHHNLVERCIAFSNANTGIQISGSSLDPKERWPSFNLVTGCIAHDNKDLAESDADGFAAKLTVGEAYAFENCVARNNCDDGWSLYTKRETGPIGSVKVERCVAYRNGIMSDGTLTKGNGNGFKLGGEGISVAHEIIDCYSFANKTSGFTANSNPAVLIRNAVSADNAGSNFTFGVYGQARPAFVLSSLYSVRTAAGPADLFSPGLLSDSVYLFDGMASKNGKGESLASDAFAAANPPVEVVPGSERPDMCGYLEQKR